MPAYKQLGNRVSSLVDVKDLKKLRSSEKTYHPPLSFSLPDRMEKIAPQRCSPEIGERWGLNLGKFYSLNSGQLTINFALERFNSPTPPE